jgi:uncharacterized protein YegP (UPF0339 family)
MAFHEEAFEGAVEITAAMMEEAEVELSAEGAEKVSEFFTVLYKKLRAVANEEDEKPCRKPGTFEVYQDGAGEYRFNLKAANNQVIAVSEGYKSKEACLNGIESVRESSQMAEVKDI